jgi:hypothetical protein
MLKESFGQVTSTMFGNQQLGDLAIQSINILRDKIRCLAIFGMPPAMVDDMAPAILIIDITLAGTNAAEVGDLGAVILGDIGNHPCVLVDVHVDEECARRGMADLRICK